MYHDIRAPDVFDRGRDCLLNGIRIRDITDHRKAATGIAGAGGLDRRVQGQKTGACGDFLVAAGKAPDIVAQPLHQAADLLRRDGFGSDGIGRGTHCEWHLTGHHQTPYLFRSQKASPVAVGRVLLVCVTR